jgi:molecular chaperone DnaK (HSP70)
MGIGIDLGTTFSAVAYLHEGKPTIVPIDGERTMPSVVRFCLNEDGLTHEVVGRRACSALDAYRNVKRVIGTGGKVPKDVAAVVPHVLLSQTGKSYKKESLLNQIDDASLHPTKLVNVSNPSESFSPHVVSSYIIQRLKDAVTNHTGLPVTRGESRLVCGFRKFLLPGHVRLTVMSLRHCLNSFSRHWGTGVL